jgi:hypothetical protein
MLLGELHQRDVGVEDIHQRRVLRVLWYHVANLGRWAELVGRHRQRLSTRTLELLDLVVVLFLSYLTRATFIHSGLSAYLDEENGRVSSGALMCGGAIHLMAEHQHHKIPLVGVHAHEVRLHLCGMRHTQRQG